MSRLPIFGFLVVHRNLDSLEQKSATASSAARKNAHCTTTPVNDVAATSRLTKAR